MKKEEEGNLLIKLAEIQEVLQTALITKDHLEGWEDLLYQINFLERVIDRIYPEKEAKKMKIKLHYSPNKPADFMFKKEIAYVEKIKRAKNTIKLIIDEYAYFGFDDFNPVKERVETEAGIKAGIFKLSRKKTRER
jgi:hypothetical protein